MSYYRNRRVAALRGLAGLVLSACSWLVLAASSLAQGPTFTPQSPLPTVIKSDWESSAFSRDGALLLAVESGRSILFEVRSGRVLRDVAVKPGVSLIAAAALDEPAAFAAVTSDGELVRVDARNGIPIPIITVGSVGPGKPFVTLKASLGGVQGGRLVALLTLTSEKLEADGTRVMTEERQMVVVSLAEKSILGRTILSDEIFQGGSAPRLTVNALAPLLAVYDAGGGNSVGLWTLHADKPAFLCALEEQLDSKVVGVIPQDDGLVIVEQSGALIHVRERNERCTTTAAPPKCVADLGAEAPIAAGLPGRRAGEILVLDAKLEGRFVEFDSPRCTAKPSHAFRLSSFDALWRIQAQLKASLRKQDNPRAFLASAFGADGEWALILNGALVHGQNDQASLQRDLIGPTGAGEMELSGSVLASMIPLAPVRLFDLESLTSRTISYDVAKFQENSFFYNRPYAIAKDLKALFVVDWDGEVIFESLDPTFGAAHGPPPQWLPKKTVGLCVSADGLRAWVAVSSSKVTAYRRKRLIDPLKPVGTIVPTGEQSSFLYKIGCDARGETAVVSSSLTDKVYVLSQSGRAAKLVQTLTISESASRRRRPSLSVDGKLLAIGGVIYERAPNGRFTLVTELPEADGISFDNSGERIVVLGPASSLRILSRRPGVGLMVGPPVREFGQAEDGAFIDGRHLMLLRNANALEVYGIADNIRVGSLAFGTDGGWIFADEASRFDASSLEVGNLAHWVMPDDPLRSLPVENFLRDYYEPQLLKRLLVCRAAGACETALPRPPPLVGLNRVPPQVVGIKVMPAKTSGRVWVDIEVARGKDPSQPNGKTSTDVFDVRLFRDGQLVARWPDTDPKDDNLEAWRTAAHIFIPDDQRSTTRRFEISVSTRNKTAAFSAYAYNEDRVKSPTLIAPPIPLAAGPSGPKKRAYVITIGVNGYEASARNLNFAVRDAEAMTRALSRLKGYEVVPIRLTSEASQTSWRATKPIIRAVLQRLSGTTSEPSLLTSVDNADQLRAAAPDDVVVLTFSGHGHTEADGRFYLLASDSGPSGAFTSQRLSQLISSDELGAWLRPIDAGQIALIIDACHSAASVDQPGFKPGPMGDRGLGQLAYDKAMIVLAASQADDVALESSSLRQGLLTYALVEEGLSGSRPADINGNSELTLAEWLTFGARRTPGLYQDLKSGTLGAKLVSRNTGAAADVQAYQQKAQTPSLFDFSRGGEAPVLAP